MAPSGAWIVIHEISLKKIKLKDYHFYYLKNESAALLESAVCINHKIVFHFWFQKRVRNKYRKISH